MIYGEDRLSRDDYILVTLLFTAKSRRYKIKHFINQRETWDTINNAKVCTLSTANLNSKKNHNTRSIIVTADYLKIRTVTRCDAVANLSERECDGDRGVFRRIGLSDETRDIDWKVPLSFYNVAFFLSLFLPLCRPFADNFEIADRVLGSAESDGAPVNA